MSQVQTRDIDDSAVILINYLVSKSSNPDDPYIEDFFTDYAGNSSWPHKGVEFKDVYLHFNYFSRNFEFEPLTIRVDHDHDVKVNLHRSELQRAKIDGYFSNVFLKGESGFLDLYRLILGQDIKPLLRQSNDIGSNGRRNFLMSYNTARAAGLPEFNPDMFPQYYDKIEELLALYHEYGLYLYASVFPDNGYFNSWADNNKKKDHWNRIGTIGQRYNNFWGIELTNEINAHGPNWIDQSKFSPIPGLISCSGSWTDDNGNPLDYPIQWDICDFHQRRNYPKCVVDAAVANYPPRIQWGKATLLGESVGFGDKSINNNREDNPRIAKEIAGTGRGTACGIIYHTQHGGFSQTYDQTEWDCGRAWFSELK